ncbi:MAG TPA: TIGR02391 family protein [Actinomycetota bacterium]
MGVAPCKSARGPQARTEPPGCHLHHPAGAAGPGRWPCSDASRRRLDVDPYPRIAQTVRSQFLLGEYELAAVAAFREVEIRIRALGRFGEEMHGVKLMQTAFGPEGPLSDPEVPANERDGVRELFTGASRAFRNPASHRTYDLGDVTMASEVVLLADLFLRMLDRIEERRASDALPETHPQTHA